MHELDIAFRKITVFYEQHVNPVFNSITNRSPLAVWEHTKETAESVPEGAQLVVFMEEPTLGLDPRNQYWFMAQVKKYAEKYGDRIHFFIATNESAVINSMPGCEYLNFFDKPAQVSKTTPRFNLSDFEV